MKLVSIVIALAFAGVVAQAQSGHEAAAPAADAKKDAHSMKKHKKGAKGAKTEETK